MGALLTLVGVAQGVDFTWTGGGADSNWTTAENWEIEETYKSTYKNKYPQSSSDVAVIAANSSAVITLTKSLTIYAFKFGTDCSLSITGVPTADGNPELYLYFGYYGSYAGIASLTLDRAKINFNSIQTWTPKAGSTFTLKNGSSITVNYFNMTAMDSISLSGGSSMSVSRFTFNGASRTVTLDDSSFIVREHALLGNSNPGGGRFIFKGAHPLFKVNGAFRSYNNNAGMTEKLRFDFEVPEGGFAETPIQSYGKSADAFGTGLDGKLMEDQTKVPDGYMQFTVTNTSPAVVKGALLDFCAYMNPFGAIRSKASNGDETTAAMRFANGAPGTSATSDAEANMIWLRIGSGDPTAEASHSSALLNHENILTKKTTSVARHVITATGWLPAVATDGSAANLELWVGESNDASAMTRASSAVVDHVGATAVDFAAPENVGEKTFYFQFRLFDVAGAVTNHTASSAVFSATTEDTTVYTWKDADGDWSGDWHDADHWATDLETKTGVPESAHATARFPRGHAISVTVDDDATVGKLDLLDCDVNNGDDSVQVTIRGKDGESYGTNKTLTVMTLDLNGYFGYLKLDRARMTVENTVTLGPRRRFELANGSSFSVSRLNSNSRGTFSVCSGSYASIGAMFQENVGTTLIIDDATMYVHGLKIGNTTVPLKLAEQNVSTSGGTVIFRGTQPVLRFAAGMCIWFYANGAYTQVLTFEVPVGGYAEAPIRTDNGTVDFPQYYGANFLKFEIDPESPCYTQVATFDTPLVSWPGSKQVLSTGKNIFGTLGDGGYFCYGTSGTSPYGWANVSGFSGTAKSIGAHVVSVAHNDLMSVSDDVGGVVVGCDPAYDKTSQSEVASAGKVPFSAPSSYESAGVRYTCTGYTLTEIEKTASGSVTNVTNASGNTFSYTIANKEISVVWHFSTDYKVDVATVNDANATVEVTAGSEYVTETVSATLTASTTSEDMEFQYWYGDLLYTNRYENPLTITAGKASTVRAFFGRKATSAGTILAESGNANDAKSWFDAAIWTGGTIPGTNDTAIVRWTSTSTYYYNRFAVSAPSFFAVKDLIISNAQVLVNSPRRGNNSGAIALEVSAHVTAPDQTRTEPVGCDIWGDLLVDCYQTDSSQYGTTSINGGWLCVGGTYQQCGSQIVVMGDMTVADGTIVVQAGYPFDTNWIDATKMGGGTGKALPFVNTNEYFRGRNFVRVLGKTTVKTPSRTDTANTVAYNVIQPVNEFRTGSAVWFDLHDLEIQSRGAFTCYFGGYGKFNEVGYAGVFADLIYNYSMCPGGHGGSDGRSGGSYGGSGGSDEYSYPVQKPSTLIATYGFANAPYHPGSSNAGSPGIDRLGAGSIRIDCNAFVLEGSLLANGTAAPTGNNKGGSSGGGIWVLAKSFTAGGDCSVQAKGGASSGGSTAGGGGGRVAICENLTDEQVESIFLSLDHTAEEISVTPLVDKLGPCFSVAGGTGANKCSDGYDGTGVYIVNIGGKRTITVAATPSNFGSPEPSYGPHVFAENEVISLVGPADAYVTDDNRSKRLCMGYTITDAEGDILVDSDERTGSYTITEDCTLTWKLTSLVHLLDVSATSGGTIVTNAIGTAGSVWQPDGYSVSLTAVPASGYAFAGWCGELPTNLQSAATLSFTHTQGRSLRALFVSTAAGEVTWTGEGDGTSWANPENWSIDAIPGPNSEVEIPAGANVVANFCVPIEVKSLAIAKGATLVVAPNGSYSTAEQPRIVENAKETDWQRIALSVSGDVTVSGTLTVGGKYSLAQFDLSVGGSLIFTDGAKGNFYAAYSAPTKFLENPSARYGTNQADIVEAAENATSGRVTVGNVMEVATNAVVSVWCDYYSGASVRFAVGSLFVAEGGKIDADGKGWDYAVYSGLKYALSPTLSDANTGGYAGGTHAGLGGFGASASHPPSYKVYGWAYAPFLPGGPGYNTELSPKTSTRAHGGGVIRIHSKRVIRCYGTISAVGGISASPYAGYVAAGGSIFLSGSRIRTSDSTVIRADGHDSTGVCGAGGGGRLVIARHLSDVDLAELEATGTCEKLERDMMTITNLASEGTPKPFKGILTAKGGLASGHTEELRRNGEDGTAYLISGAGNGLTIIVK